MSKLDEVKEILNTLRVALSLSFGIVILIIGSVIHRYDSGKVDIFFWAGWVSSIIVAIIIVIIIKRIARYTKEIKDL